MSIWKIQNDAFRYVTRKEEYIATRYASHGHNHLLCEYPQLYVYISNFFPEYSPKIDVKLYELCIQIRFYAKRCV